MSEEAGRESEQEVPEEVSGDEREAERGPEQEPQGEIDGSAETAEPEPGEEEPEPEAEPDEEQEAEGDEGESPEGPEAVADEPEPEADQAEQQAQAAEEESSAGQEDEGAADESPDELPDESPAAFEQADDLDEDETEQLPPRRLPPADLDLPDGSEPSAGLEPPADFEPSADESPRQSKTSVMLLSVICFALVLGMVTDFLLHRYDADSPEQITGEIMLHIPLDGVWTGPGGARITLSGSPGSGTFTFSGIPSTMFAISDGDWPAAEHDGTWNLGRMTGSQWSESGLVLVGRSGGGDPPQLMLLPIGSPLAPQLACYFPVDTGVCVFTKQ